MGTLGVLERSMSTLGRAKGTIPGTETKKMSAKGTIPSTIWTSCLSHMLSYR